MKSSLSRSDTGLCPFMLLGLLAFISAAGLGRAQEALPEPARIFTPKTTLAVYLDLQRASQSQIWKTLEAKLGPLEEQLRSLSQLQSQWAAPPPGMSDLDTGALGEIAISIEGENALKNLETEQYDADFSVVAALRFSETVDQQQLIEQVLAALEEQKPGLRARLEQSRTRSGAVDWFDLPAEAIDGNAMPFPLGLAIGPGRGGSVLGLGKTEALRKFISGQTDGRLPAGIAASLAQRSQIWLYFPVRSEMLKDLSAEGAGAEEANPMIAGLAPGLEKVKEFGLGFSFGATSIGVELALGCSDNAAARELQEGLQQLLGMVQMMASQNPSAAPRFLTRLKAATAGTIFRLTTEVTVQDVELALKSSGISPAKASRPPSSPGSAPSAGPTSSTSTRIAAEPPVAVDFLELIPSDEQQLRYTRLRVTNRSPKPVREIKVTFAYYDRAGRKIGDWTRRHLDPVASNVAPAESTREIRCPTFHVPSTTQRVTLTLHEVVFADGEKWSPSP